VVEVAENDVDALVLLAEQVLDGDLDVVKGDVAGAGGGRVGRLDGLGLDALAAGDEANSVFGLIRLASNKSLGIRLLELLVLYVVTGSLAVLLEHRAGQIAPQAWQFYAITGTLFITFAFPGFVYRYLLKR